MFSATTLRRVREWHWINVDKNGASLTPIKTDSDVRDERESLEKIQADPRVITSIEVKGKGNE
jgi:hypothetical protein